MQENGQVVPAGAGVEVTTQDNQVTSFLVGDEGLAYLTNLTANNRLNVFWEDHHCAVSLTVPTAKSNQTLNDYGQFICKPASN